ncbi:sulfotransferase family 2 domain-containing protein [Demequina sp.]|uniref:sulfotransferase family 2 domain-containing protein n=1 Tax=Demequina sp. TaxID=2050685 RepID=UPI003A8B2BD6
MPLLRKNGVALLFVHVPKTGGTSVENAFRDAGWDVDMLSRRAARGTENWYRRCSPQHLHAADLADTLRLERIDASFCFVREPRRRLISEYVWRHRTSETIDTHSHAFEAWTTKVFRESAADPYTGDNHIRPQVEFVLPTTHVFRLEDSLEAGMARLAELTGVDVPTDMPRAQEASRATGITAADVDVTELAAEQITAFYREDYRQFGYDVPGTGAAPAQPRWRR